MITHLVTHTENYSVCQAQKNRAIPKDSPVSFHATMRRGRKENENAPPHVQEIPYVRMFVNPYIRTKLTFLSVPVNFLQGRKYTGSLYLQTQLPNVANLLLLFV